MVGHKILLPYNFTAYDQKALDFVIRNFSHLKNVEITLLNIYTPAPKVDINGFPIVGDLKENITYLSRKIKQKEDNLRAAMQNLLQNGFSEHQVKYIFKPRKKDIATEIILLALDHQFNLIVINHKPGKLSHFFTGNVYSKIVDKLKNITVCVVT